MSRGYIIGSTVWHVPARFASEPSEHPGFGEEADSLCTFGFRGYRGIVYAQWLVPGDLPLCQFCASIRAKSAAPVGTSDPDSGEASGVGNEPDTGAA